MSRSLREQFNEIDTDRDGSISYAELKEYLVEEHGADWQQVFTSLEFFDGDGDMAVSFEEFCTYIRPAD